MNAKRNRIGFKPMQAATGYADKPGQLQPRQWERRLLRAKATPPKRRGGTSLPKSMLKAMRSESRAIVRRHKLIAEWYERAREAQRQGARFANLLRGAAVATGTVAQKKASRSLLVQKPS